MKSKWNVRFKKVENFLFYVGIVLILTSCAWGNQRVVWKTDGKVDFNKSVEVNVVSRVEMPDEEKEFLKTDIENKLRSIFNFQSQDKYTLDVIITKYDEGDASVRFILAGLGNMYLDGDVILVDNKTNIKIREGSFKKKYSVGGLVGGMATMRDDLTSKVGKAIAEALSK